MEKNEILEKIFLLFVGKDNYSEKIVSGLSNLKNGALSYDQLLCLLISARYVIKTIAHNNSTNGLYYNLVTNPKSIISTDFMKHYFKFIGIYIKEQIEISFLTYRIINYIILSHIYFGNLLGNISLEDAKLISLFKKDKKADNKDNYLFISLIKEFDDIKKKLLDLIGIKKIIIFMNSIFEEVSSIIIDIKTNDDFIKKESEIDSAIKDKISCFNEYTENYYKTIASFKKYDSIIKDIFLENYNFYNNEKENPDSKFPLISYFTSTNYCSYEDFKNMRLYLINDENENKYYPMIESILKNSNIIVLVDTIPKINSFINEIYNKLLLKQSEEDVLNKDIKSVVNINKDKLDLFNKSLQNIIKKYNLKDINIKINDNSKIKDVINIKDNNIFKIYNLIIDEYNKFLSNIDIYKPKNKEMEPKPVIIQNASENDYITFKIYRNNKTNIYNTNNNVNNNDENIFISAKERLCEIFYLYSNRNRVKEYKINDNNDEKTIYKINVADGGKITYDYDLIENELEKEFIFGKKLFSTTQNTFIFSNNVFSDERNDILIKLNEKYPQKEIESEILNKIEDFLNNQEILYDIYTNMQYIIIYLMIYEKDSQYDCKKDNQYDCKKDSQINCERTINQIINIIEKGNFKMNEQLRNFADTSSLLIINLLSFYELIELKVFKNLTQEIKEKINKSKSDLNIKE